MYTIYSWYKKNLIAQTRTFQKFCKIFKKNNIFVHIQNWYSYHLCIVDTNEICYFKENQIEIGSIELC